MSDKAKRKQPAGKTTDVTTVEQPHGGALKSGGTPGNAGGLGRPPSAIRTYCRGSFEQRIPILEAIADGVIEAGPKERIRAIDVLAKYGGVDKIAITEAEQPVAPKSGRELAAEYLKRLEQVRTVEDMERLLTEAAQKQADARPN